MVNFDTKRAIQDLKELAYPRYVGTDGEKKAAKYIKNELEKTGLETRIEDFSYSFSAKFLRKSGHLIQAMLFLFTGYFVGTRPRWSFLQAVILLVFLSLSTRWGKFFGTSLSKGKKHYSKNIIASHKVSEAKKKIILMAHYDTKSELLPMKVRILILNISIIGGIIFSFSLIVANILSMISPFIVPNTHFLVIGVFLFLITLLLAFNKTSDVSPGIIDNGSGVAVLLETARNISQKRPKAVDIDFVITSAEEIGLVGSLNYLNRHKKELDRENTYIINLDIVASGDLFYNSGFGFPMIKTNQKLNNLLLETAAENNIKINKRYFPTGLAADHMPFVEKGYKATWLLSAMPHVHTKKDALDNINNDTLENAGILIQKILPKMDMD